MNIANWLSFALKLAKPKKTPLFTILSKIPLN